MQGSGRLEDTIEAVQASLGDMLSVVTAVSRSFKKVFDETGADTAELELGLQNVTNRG